MLLDQASLTQVAWDGTYATVTRDAKDSRAPRKISADLHGSDNFNTWQLGRTRTDDLGSPGRNERRIVRHL